MQPLVPSHWVSIYAAQRGYVEKVPIYSSPRKSQLMLMELPTSQIKQTICVTAPLFDYRLEPNESVAAVAPLQTLRLQPLIISSLQQYKYLKTQNYLI